MRIFLLLLALLVHLSAAAQTIVLPHPDSIATKEWVRSLLKGEAPQVPSVPTTPVLEPCKQGPDLRAITNISNTSATFRFHGEGVYELQWEVVGTAYKGKVKPTSAEIGIAYKLEPGTYTLRIQGTSCAGVSTKSFTIADKVGSLVPPTLQGNLPPPNNGVHWQEAGNYHLRYITGRRADWQISETGKLTDAFKDSYTKDQRTLQIYDDTYHAYYFLFGKPIADLKELALPAGSYYIQKIYARASKFPDLQSVVSRPWQLYPEDRSVGETVNTELLIAKDGKLEGLLPTFYPNFLSQGKGLSKNKLAAFKNQYDVPDAALLGKGITHIQDTGGNNDIAPAVKFTLAKRYTGGLNLHGNEDDFANAGRNYAIQTGENKQLLLTSEIGEELVNIGVNNPTPLTTAFFRGYYTQLKNKYPDLKPSDTNIFGEYGGIDNVGKPSEAYQNSTQLAEYYQVISSTQQARRAFNPSHSSFAEHDNSYYSYNRLEFQNVLLRLYYQSLADMGGGFFPNYVFVVERLKVANPDKKIFVFGWEKIQDLNRVSEGYNFLDVADGWSYKFTEPDGSLYVGQNPGTAAPAYICYGVSFFSQWLGHGFGVWSDASGIKNVAVETHSANFLKDGGNWKSWKPQNGDWTDWKPNTSGQPNLGTQSGFYKYPLTAIDGFYQGAEDYASIESRADLGKYWLKYSTDGGQTWYTPEQGSNGLEVGDLDKPNFFSKHPAVDIAAKKLPIAFIGEGTEGKVLVYYNTYKLPMQTDNVVIEHKGVRYQIGELIGSKLHLVKL